MADANAVFDLVDADKSGEIDPTELMLYLLGQGHEHESVSRLFAVLDTDGNGSISRQEFIAGFDKLIAAESVMRRREIQPATLLPSQIRRRPLIVRPRPNLVFSSRRPC